MKGFQRGSAAGGEFTFSRRIMVFCAILPGVVGDFVIIPDVDEWHRRMYSLEVRIGMVLGIALTVVVQRQQFARRQDFTAEGCGIA